MQLPIQEEEDRLIVRWFSGVGSIEIARILQKAAARMGEVGIIVCEVFIGVKRDQALADWRAFLAALEPILVSGIQIRFRCKEEETARWLQSTGLYLVGPIENGNEPNDEAQEAE